MAAPSSRDAAPLIERDREVDALAGLIAATAGGGAGGILIEGPAEIGKSGLLGELRSQATGSGLRVLSARAGELERDFPFGIVRQLFDPLLADPSVRERWLADAAAAAAVVFDTGAEAAGLGEDAAFSTLHGLHWLTVNAAADGPLLLAIDDLHWCDRPSLRFLAYLARRLEGLPVLLGATLRTGEAGTDVALVGELASAPRCVVLRPGPLSAAAVAALVRARLGADAAPAFSDACHEATGGNPLLLRQLLSALAADSVRPEAGNVTVVRDIGPRAASRGVLLRLGRLPDGAIPVAQAVAVLGDGATLPAVAAIAGLDEPAAAESIADLARAEILLAGAPLGFVHPLVRDAVHRELQPGERDLAHDHAARLLRDSGAPADQIAAHLLHVPPRGEAWVAELLADAARTASRRGAPESAVAYYERALAEPPSAELRPALLFELSLTAWIMEGHDALPYLHEAHAAQRDPLLRPLAAINLARTYVFTATPARCREIVAEAIRELPDEFADLHLALRALDGSALYFGAGGSTDPGRLAERRGTPPDAQLGARMLGSIAALDAMVGLEPAEDCARWALEVLADDLLASGDPGLFWPMPVVVLALADRDEVANTWERIETITQERGSAFGVLTINTWKGFTLMYAGELAEAEEHLREGVHQSKLWGIEMRSSSGIIAGFLASVLVERGKLDEARAALPEVPQAGDFSDGANGARAAFAELLLHEGRPAEALAHAQALEQHAVAERHPVWSPWRGLEAACLHALGRTDDACALAADELALARRWGSPNVVGRGLRILGELEGEAGIPRLEESVALLAGSHARLEYARALAALGTALRLARRPTEAREPLRQALDLADRCGADGLVERVRSELYATGSRPRSTALGGVDALTARELRVAALVAKGATNRDVAQTLYVTPKTVEVHLSNTYRKLGIRSRRELTGALAQAA